MFSNLVSDTLPSNIMHLNILSNVRSFVDHILSSIAMAMEEEMMMRKRMTYADMKIVWGGFVVQVSSENFIPLLRAFLQRKI